MRKLAVQNELNKVSRSGSSQLTDPVSSLSEKQQTHISTDSSQHNCRLSITTDKPEYLCSFKPTTVKIDRLKKSNCDSEQDICLEKLTNEASGESSLLLSRDPQSDLDEKPKLQKQVSFSHRVELTIKDFNSSDNAKTVKLFLPMTGLEDKQSIFPSTAKKRSHFQKRSETY